MDTSEKITGSRRHFLASSAWGLSTLATSWLIQNQKEILAAPPSAKLRQHSFDLKAKEPNFPSKAKAMISMFMQGGPSHVDLMDPKPTLAKFHMKKYPGKVKYDDVGNASDKVFNGPWKFKKHGKCGTEISELLPGLASIVDDVTIIRSMHTDVNNHNQSIRALHTGKILPGRPTMGSWVTYGLGAETDQLPAYVAMTDPSGEPVEGYGNWSNGWLPSMFQATVVRPREPRILNLQTPAHLKGKTQDRYLEYLRTLNKNHADSRKGEFDLQSRMASFELAAKMQTAAKEALDISKETKKTLEMYGIGVKETDEYGKRCLIARRLVERDVRFVQIFTGNQYWDHHGNIINSLPKSCKKVDIPGTALVKDLKQRGLLDSTIVHWGGEMGRLPVIQNEKNIGRDHNTYGFSHWIAGGGFKGGMTYGQTDEFGHKAIENKVSHNDFQKTVLHLFGLDSDKLTYFRNNKNQSLIDGQKSRLVKEIIA